MAIIFRQFQRGRKESVKEDFLDYIDNKKDQFDFLWKHTGKRNSDGSEYNPEKSVRADIIHDAMKDKDKGEKSEGSARKKSMKDKKEDGVPQALCAIQADTTENMLDIFKIAVAEDPGPFRLGDNRYWAAMSDGRWKHLAHTFDDFIAKKPTGTEPKKVAKKRAPANRKKSNASTAKKPVSSGNEKRRQPY